MNRGCMRVFNHLGVLWARPNSPTLVIICGVPTIAVSTTNPRRELSATPVAFDHVARGRLVAWHRRLPGAVRADGHRVLVRQSAGRQAAAAARSASREARDLRMWRA